MSDYEKNLFERQETNRIALKYRNFKKLSLHSLEAKVVPGRFHEHQSFTALSRRNRTPGYSRKKKETFKSRESIKTSWSASSNSYHQVEFCLPLCV